MIDKSAIKIFAVDDEPFMLKLHLRTLATMGYTSVTACEGASKALEAMDLTDMQPDLILLDLNMPDIDGIEFLRHLVTRDYRGSVILVSGEDERVLQGAEKLVQAHNITALGHLRKPVKPEMLAACLQNWKPAVTLNASLPSKTYPAQAVASAINNGELINYYQPKVSLTTGQVVGVESLVRWRHPLDGLVFPDQFIGVAEAHGLISGLTRQVIAGALGDAWFWQQEWKQETGLKMQVAVNVSMDDLGSLDFVDFVVDQAAAARVQPNMVILEVTESKLTQDFRVALEVLTRLRLRRFRISIDDFGTGHSSLAQLRDMPFDELKIDRGFVHGAGDDATVRAIFDTSLKLAKQLNMVTVTEGVEDRADWDFVRRSGCDMAQGYFIGKPMPGNLLPEWIADWEDRDLIKHTS